MNAEEQERFECALRQVAPAKLPAELLDRLRAAKPCAPPVKRARPRKISWLAGWWAGWRWVMAATPVVLAAIIVLRMESRPGAGPGKISSAASPGMKINAVQVDHALVSSFDAVVQLPGGEPVRFRCRKWMDAVRMSDDSHGVMIERSSPRVEVIPVRFETY